MNITISGRHVDTSDAFRDHVIDCLNCCVFDKYKIEPIEVSVVITKVRHFFECELSVHLAKGIYIRVKGVGVDGYEASDNAASKLSDRVRKYKNKLKDLKHKKDPSPVDEHIVSSYIIPSSHVADEQNDSTEQQSEEEKNPPVIAEIKIDIPSLSVNDAIMHMDLSDDQLFIFKSKKNGGVNVLFKRDDGNIGWIDVTSCSDNNNC